MVLYPENLAGPLLQTGFYASIVLHFMCGLGMKAERKQFCFVLLHRKGDYISIRYDYYYYGYP